MAEPTLSTAMNPTVREILGTLAVGADLVATESPAALDTSVAGQILKPARSHGLGRSVEEFISVVCEVAVVHSSLAWLTAMFNAAAYEVAALHTDVADELWKTDPSALVTIGIVGEGGLADSHLTGRWNCVIGAEHADWLLLPAHNGSTCRVLVPRSDARIEAIHNHAGLAAAGVCDVTVTDLTVDPRRVFGSEREGIAVAAAAGAAAAVVGSADGLWRTHREQVRAQLTTSHGGEEVSDVAAAQVARAASDIDAAKLQITASLGSQTAIEDVAWTCHQAVARARSAADRLLAHSRHALNEGDAVTRKWRDVHAGCRLAVPLFDGPAPPLR